MCCAASRAPPHLPYLLPPCVGVFLLRHLQLNQQDRYWKSLRTLLLQAQNINEPRMINNPYIVVSSMLDA